MKKIYNKKFYNQVFLVHLTKVIIDYITAYLPFETRSIGANKS